jgi:hypothetical protein
MHGDQHDICHMLECEKYIKFVIKTQYTMDIIKPFRK